ncbi:MAG: hypothetical protein ACE5NG_08615 [bacterium]
MKSITLSLKIQILILTVFTIFLGCTASKNQAPMEKNMLRKIYVETVESKNLITEAEELEVTVRGNLPSPAYTFDHFDVQVKGNVIEITPLAKHDPNKIVAQVLVPFEEVCRVKNLKPGNYQVKVNSRVETVKVEKLVRVKE